MCGERLKNTTNHTTKFPSVQVNIIINGNLQQVLSHQCTDGANQMSHIHIMNMTAFICYSIHLFKRAGLDS